MNISLVFRNILTLCLGCTPFFKLYQLRKPKFFSKFEFSYIIVKRDSF